MNDDPSDSLRRIVEWMRANHPAGLANLGDGASDPQLRELEATLGRPLPAELRHLLTHHDGEKQGWVPGLLPDGFSLLPAAQIAEVWDQQAALSEEEGGPKDDFSEWRLLIRDDVLSVRGPVKPHLGTRAWIPFATIELHVQWLLDYDPAPGGRDGQVIEVDLEGCRYEVLAPSFADFLQAYADALEQGIYSLDGGRIETKAPATDSTEWGLPDYLR